MLAFVFEPVERCRAQIPALERVAARHRDVKFRDRRRALRPAERAFSGASLPVGYDNDGAVANEYAVVVCPTITYVRAGGRVAGSTVGPLDEARSRTGWAD